MSSAQNPLCHEHSTFHIRCTDLHQLLPQKHPQLRSADQSPTIGSTSIWRRTRHLPADNTIRKRRRPSQRHNYRAGWGRTSFTCHGVLSRRTPGYRTGTCSSEPPPPPPATPPLSPLPTEDRTCMNSSKSPPPCRPPTPPPPPSQRNSHRVFWKSDVFHVLRTFSLLTTTQLRVTVSKRDNKVQDRNEFLEWYPLHPHNGKPQGLLEVRRE